jgi:cell division protein FtsI (penicillin-binding protein 3)
MMCLLGIAIMGKIFTIQFVQGQTWKGIAEEHLFEVREITPSRGQILATDGSLLATSVPIFDIYWDSRSDAFDGEAFKQQLDSMAHNFSVVIGDRSKAEYKSLFLKARNEGNRYKKIAAGINYSQKKAIENGPFLRLGRYKSGFVFERQQERLKPFGRLAARTIGIAREEKSVGLENFYNDILAGKSGKRLEQRIPGGYYKPVSDKYIVEPEEGYDLVTSIDIHLQDVATTALEEQLIEHGASWGTVVMMEVETGFIKAIANLQLDTISGKYEEMLNHAIGTRIEPGSTFKLPSMIAAIDEGLANPTDTVDTYKGNYSFYGSPMQDSNVDDGGNGLIDVHSAFSLSSNIGTAKTIHKAFGRNPQRFLDKLREMGLSESTGIDLLGEVAPQFAETVGQGGWSKVSPTQISIGYEVLQTPLQTLTFYNAVANKGKMVRPRIVTEFRRNGEVEKRFKPDVIREQICSEKTLSIAQEMLEAVVDSGTAKDVFSDCRYDVAGKTGTSRVTIGKTYAANRYRASFCGYFPADNPRYSCIVVINEPRSGIYYASLIAAPVFRILADKIYATEFDLHLKEPETPIVQAILPTGKDGSRHDLTFVYEKLGIPCNSTSSNDYVNIKTGADTVLIEDRNIPRGKIPNVIGMGLQDAIYLLESTGLRVSVSGYGTVKRQSLPAGSPAFRGQSINIELS